jgi:7-keto-8-aminopelargonate synthetase-like enzyme
LFCNALLNFGRAYVFSTSVPPFVAAAAEAAIAVMRDEPERQSRLRKLASLVRSKLGATGDSPIVPIILGDEKRTLDAADQLMSEGLLILGVRPPTVPKGGSRLRVTLSSQHTDDEIDQLTRALKKVIDQAKDAGDLPAPSRA